MLLTYSALSNIITNITQKTKITNHLFLRASVKSARSDMKKLGFNFLLLTCLPFFSSQSQFFSTMCNSGLLLLQDYIKLQHSQSGLKAITKSTYYYKQQG